MSQKAALVDLSKDRVKILSLSANQANYQNTY